MAEAEERIKARLVIALVLALAACTSLAPVSYNEPVAVKSDLRAAVALVSGAVRGAKGTTVAPAGNIFVPLAIGPMPHLQFNLEDQRTFVASFRSELQRLNVVGEALDAAAVQRADLGIQIIFAQTQHNPEGQTYVLDVVMEIIGGERPFLRQYRIVSSEGDSLWQRMNTNAAEGKSKAAAKLMKLLIPDVAAYISQNRSPIGAPGVDRST